MQAKLTDPGDIETFRLSVLDLGERQRHASIYALHRDLLTLRRTDPVLGRRPCRVDGAALTDEAWMLRFFSESGADRLLIVNLGRDLLLGPAPEPLLAPVDGQVWRLLWSSEAPLYGGAGGPAQDAEGDWLIPGQAASVLAPGPSVTVPKEKKLPRSPRSEWLT
jgi:maltooligosyltrehalose trehalohydrolase